MDLKVNFSGRAIRYTEEEIAVVVEAMRNADPLTQGVHMREFESKFAAYQGVAPGSCFVTMNGVSALELSAQLCRFKPGDEVIMPSHTFTASAYPYIKKGATLAWADVDLLTRVVTAESIEKVITPRTKAVVVVHLYGYVADMPAIAALCKKRGLILIEDAAQSIGSELEGKKAGSFGDMGVFSFHSHKNLTTLGEGGMVAVPDTPLDKVLMEHLQRRGVPCVAGSEDDVLARFCLAAKAADAGSVVRVCADNPLIWGGAIDRLVDFYAQGQWDYAYNHIPRNNLWPDGLGAEILSRELLDELNAKAAQTSQREHCLNYIWDNAANFSIGTFDPQEAWLRRPELKLDMAAASGVSVPGCGAFSCAPPRRASAAPAMKFMMAPPRALRENTMVQAGQRERKRMLQLKLGKSGNRATAAPGRESSTNCASSSGARPRVRSKWRPTC